MRTALERRGPAHMTPHMLLLLKRHLRVVIRTYAEARLRPGLDADDRRIIHSAQSEAQTVLNRLEQMEVK